MDDTGVINGCTRAFAQINRRVFGGKPVPMDEAGAVAEFEFMVECALDGYKEQSGQPGDARLDRNTLDELLDMADQWHIHPTTAEQTIAKAQERRLKISTEESET